MEWISVKDKLPEKNDRYLTLDSFPNNYKIGVSTGSFENGGWVSTSITHWMPLPEPPIQ